MKILAPMINDVATDLDDPPAFSAGQRGELPDSFRRAIRRHYPEIGPLRLELPAPRSHELAARVARRQRSWQLTRVDGARLAIEGVARSRLFRFADDFVIRVRPDGGGSVVDMRSASRLGKGDLGANAERIGRFLDELLAAAQRR